MDPIPIFIITCDRLTVLKQSVEAYLKTIKTPFDLVFHDNGSTYKPTVEYLNSLEKMGYSVYRSRRVKHVQELNSIQLTIIDYFSKHPTQYYCVADCDVTLPEFDDILLIYKGILEKYNYICTGPHWRRDDIPQHCLERRPYLKDDWLRHPTRQVEVLEKTITGYEYFIDTSFGMYHPEFIFFRHQPAYVTLAPFHGRHLDWYLDPENPPEDQQFYVVTCSKEISHV